jgi:uncharacterized membrane protein
MFAHYDQDKRFVAPRLWWRLGVGVLALVAMAGGAYSALALPSDRLLDPFDDRWHFMGFAFGTAADSPWATWFGIPVGLPAMVVYGALALALCWVGPRTSSGRQGRAWRLLLGLSLFILAAAGWFALVQIIWLNRVCGLCVLGEAAGSLAALAVIVRGPIRLQRRRRPQHDPIKIRRHTVVWLAGSALAVVAILVTGQVLTGWLAEDRFDGATLARSFKPAQTRPAESDPLMAPDGNFLVAQEYSHQSIDMTTALVLPTPRPAATQATESPRTPTIFRFRSGIPINPVDYPLLGRSDAPAMALWVFDYHDPSSRVMYHQIEEARRRFGPQLAIIAVPVDAPPSAIRSLDYVPATQPVDPKDDLTALAIIVAKVKPPAFATFHAFLLGSDKPPSLEAARRMAASLIGEEQMRILHDGKDLQDQLLRHMAIFRRSEFAWVPQLHAGGARAVVLPQDAEAQTAIFDFFQNKLNLKPVESPLPPALHPISDAFSSGHP